MAITTKRKIFAGLMLLFCSFFFVASPSVGADYPKKAVKLIVPWKAGGGTDAIMRIFAEYLGKELGGTVVIVNVPGVSGTLGLKQGAEAKADGYTLVTLHESVICTYLTGVTKYNFENVIPIANVTSTPIIMAAGKDASWNNMQDLTAYAKQHPGEVKFGASLGANAHFTILDYSDMAGVDVKIVPYNGQSARQTALLGGFIDVAETSPAAGKSYFKSGMLKPLAIASEERHPNFPDVPTMQEQGLDILFSYHRGICAPKGTPKEVTDKLAAAIDKVCKNEDFIKKMASLGTDVAYLNVSDYQKYLSKVSDRMDALADKFSIKKLK